MDFLKGVIGPLNSKALKDTAKLVVVGSTIEATRRASTNVWNSFVDSFFLTAHFSQEDYPYDWIMHWLSKQPTYNASREFDVGTARSGSKGIETVDGETEEGDGIGRRRAIAFLPSLEVTHSIFYHGHWLKITRTRRAAHCGGYAEIKISVVARNNTILKTLVLQARREYEVDMEHRVHIFLAESSSWRWNGAHQKRPLSSVVLEPGVKDMLISDTKDFLASEAWYADRGIPYRRGYLLHGVPGSGKTSLIHAIAGELNLDIYVVSLSAKGMSDNTLTTLLSRVPSRCILLLEDLDAAFTRSVTRDSKSTGVPIAATTTTTTAATSTVATVAVPEDPNTLSLSGLLNSLDGVAASTGRLLFATTNHVERLDPALTRPGRLDVHVDFKHASKWQARGIFRNFFPTKPKAGEAVETGDPSKPGNVNVTTKKSSRHVIPLLEEEELDQLADEFAAQIPEDELSVAGLQGYLLKNKTRPREAVKEVGAWIEKEREARAKIQKLKEEEEAKANKETVETESKAKDTVAIEKEKEKPKETEEKTTSEKVDEQKEEKPKVRRLKRRAPGKAEPAVAKSTISSSSPDLESDSEDLHEPSPIVRPQASTEIDSSSSETPDTLSASTPSTSVPSTVEDSSAVTSEVESEGFSAKSTGVSNSKWVSVEVPVTVLVPEVKEPVPTPDTVDAAS